LSTTADSLTIKATIDIENPTDYTAFIPYANVHVYSNGSYIGNVTVTDLDVVHGVNSNLTASATWAPKESLDGRELLSQWLSGKLLR